VEKAPDRASQAAKTARIGPFGAPGALGVLVPPQVPLSRGPGETKKQEEKSNTVAPQLARHDREGARRGRPRYFRAARSERSAPPAQGSSDGTTLPMIWTAGI